MSANESLDILIAEAKAMRQEAIDSMVSQWRSNYVNIEPSPRECLEFQRRLIDSLEPYNQMINELLAVRTPDPIILRATSTDPLQREVASAHSKAVLTPTEDERLLDAWAQSDVEVQE